MYVPPDLMQVAIIITHKKSITTLVWHHGYSELNTSGKHVIETSVTVNNRSPIQDYVHPDDEVPNRVFQSRNPDPKFRAIP